VTRTPDPPAPSLLCPWCDEKLTYMHTIIGGVKPTEYWDHFACGPCRASFQYRRRTKHLRRTN
jgi:hypothetical protein